MNRKKKALLGASIVSILVGGVFFGDAYHLDFVRYQSRKNLPLKTHSGSSAKPAILPRPGVSADVLINPWDYHKPLTEGERRDLEVVETQIRKFLTWGKMDPEGVNAFRQTLFKMGDRAVADVARELSQITRDELQDRAAAEEVVRKIDVLAYFADSSNPLAADSIAAMAKRAVNWNEAGELLNPVEANITFEMFDVFAKIRPGEASAFISTIEKGHRLAYFTRYAYGRRLAGKTMEDIDLELRAVFDSPELALK